MSTATLPPESAIEAIEAFQEACLKRIQARPRDGEVHDRILDLYLETVQRLDKGWTMKSVLTNSLIRLDHL